MENEKKFLSVDEFGEYIGMSKSYIYKRISNNSIPYVKLGGVDKFVKEHINQWVIKGGQMGMNLPDLGIL